MVGAFGQRIRSPALAFPSTSRPSELLPTGTNTAKDRRWPGMGTPLMVPPRRSAPALMATRSTRLPRPSESRFVAPAKPKAAWTT
jgi:hypothetical protein